MSPLHSDELNPPTRAHVFKQRSGTEGGTTALAIVEHSSQLAKLEQARQMLAECRTLSEVKKIRSIAEGARVYARAAHLGMEAQNYAAEISLLAARKAGEILQHLEKKKSSGVAASVAGTSEYAKILEETQTPERTAQYWQLVATAPTETFENYVRETRESNREITAEGLIKAYTKTLPLKAKKEPPPLEQGKEFCEWIQNTIAMVEIFRCQKT